MNIYSKELLHRVLPVDWVQPVIYSNGTPYVSELAAASNYGTAWWLFDNNNNTIVQQYENERSSTGYWTMYMKTPVKASRMLVTYGPKTDAFNGVKTKTVQVYKNGSWVTLYTKTADGLGDGEPGTTQIYPVNPDGYYQAYRLLTTTDGRGRWDAVRIAGIRLEGVYEDFI